jgi:aspartate aminotransferase-like enzyme
MNSITHTFLPGPTIVLPEVLQAYSYNGAPKEFSTEFYQQYGNVQNNIAAVLNVNKEEGGSVIIECGEAMCALWGAMKSVLKPGSRVLCIGNGFYGFGCVDMVLSIGAEVEQVGAMYEPITDLALIEEKLSTFKPHLVTMCHCETPSSILNPLEEIGNLVKKYNSLFYVDCVSSAFGVPIDVQKMNIDFCLIGGQKVLSLLSDLSIIAISGKAWKVVEEIDYKGYDSLKPWRYAPHKTTFPYTHNARAVDAMDISLSLLEKEGWEQVYLRHQEVAEYCRERILSMGLALFPKHCSIRSPTVTAILVPDEWAWDDLNTALREKGVMFAGNMADLKNKVFRIGHMGAQCDKTKVAESLDILATILKERKS